MPGLLFPRNHQLFPVNKVSVQIRIVRRNFSVGHDWGDGRVQSGGLFRSMNDPTIRQYLITKVYWTEVYDVLSYPSYITIRVGALYF